MQPVHSEDLRDAYLMCRTIGHAWFDASSSELAPPEAGHWWWLLHCQRCESRRIDLISERTGDVASRRYVYPEGYEIDETVVRSQLRQEWAKRRTMPTRRRKVS